ncbi:hypothetical protein LINPERHAP1_LOCUS34448 [Linum perenne]
MGLACCTPVKHKQLPNGAEFDIPHSNVRCSPALNIRWENRRRVAGEMEESLPHIPLRLGREYGEEIKVGLGSGRSNPSPCGSLPDSFGTPISLKSPVHEEIFRNEAANISNMSVGSSCLVGLQTLAVSPEIAESSVPKMSYSVNSSYSTPLHPSTACFHPLPPGSTPSRRARRSPGHRLLRQISDSRILGLKSPNSNSLSEGRPSFVLSMRSHDLAISSSGSDGWSMRTFSELVASSQRGRWSFDGEQFDASGGDKTSGSSSRFSSSPSVAPHTCSSCSKLLNDVSPWRSQVVAVLDCGHVYHAECLEAATSEVDKYDPVCPTCITGEKQIQKVAKVPLRPCALRKGKGHKISRNRVVDSSIDSDSDSVCERESSRRACRSSGTSSSSKMSFLKRHFSFGSKWSNSASQNASSSKKAIWPRQHKC